MTYLQLLFPLDFCCVDFSVSGLACSPMENIDVNILEMSFVKRVLTYSDDPVQGVVSSLK